MSAETVYQNVSHVLNECLPPEVDAASRERLALLVTGLIQAQSASPARIAAALHQLGLSPAQLPSLERRLRRIQNDPELTASLCFHPFARQRLAWSRPPRLVLVLDTTTQADRVTLLTASVWYRGRALPLAWAAWPAQQRLPEPLFWTRVQAVLAAVATLLPVGVPVIWLADRAFGTPRFTDVVESQGWGYVVRVQGQTRYRDRRGREGRVGQLVRWPGQRAKLRGQVFKKNGWRAARLVGYWGRRHRSPLCLVSNLGLGWELLGLYRQRYAIEAGFRDYKSGGWRWQQGQVRDERHRACLLMAMALATWVVLGLGSQAAQTILQRPPTGQRRTRAWEAKHSLFQLGLQQWHAALHQPTPAWAWGLCDWSAPNWSTQLYSHHARAFVFAPVRP
jgi:hypothetical protein